MFKYTRVIQKLNTHNKREGKGNHGCEGGNLTAYIPDLAPSDFHLFLHLKKHLANQKFHENEEVNSKVSTWLCVPVTEFYNIGIQKLTTRLNNCLDKGGDYVEK
jgi:hypothetical protein